MVNSTAEIDSCDSSSLLGQVGRPARANTDW